MTILLFNNSAQQVNTAVESSNMLGSPHLLITLYYATESGVMEKDQLAMPEDVENQASTVYSSCDYH